MESHPKEVVILACRHFEGLSDALHHFFICNLKKLFGAKLCLRQVSLFPYMMMMFYALQDVPFHG